MNYCKTNNGKALIYQSELIQASFQLLKRLIYSNFPKVFILLLGLIFLLSACAASVALTKKDRSSIKSVGINKDVTIADEMFYQGRQQAILAGTLGIIGAGAAADGAKDSKSMLKAVMDKNNIDLKQIVQEQFEKELKSSGLFASVGVHEKADADFKLAITLYGLAQPHGLSSQLKPLVRLKGTLARPDGSIIWEKTEYVHNLSNGTPSHTLEEYLNTPEFIREAFTIASKIAASSLVRDMMGD